MPERWLDPHPPYGEDVDAVFEGLRHYLGPEGLRLLQAMAVYPEPRWALTQALDFLLFPGADWETRERRLRSISRLPWPRHAYLPDYLREFLLRRMSRAERRDVRNAYAALLNGLTEDRGARTIELPIAVASERTFRRLLADLVRARSAPGELDHAIFLNILHGGRLGLLDFELPKIAARLLPRGRIWVDARALLAAALVAAGAGWAFHEGWTRWGAPELRAYWERVAREENARWTVKLTLAGDASDFAGDFEELLTQRGYRVQVGKDQADRSRGNTLLYPPGGAKVAVRLAQALRHWTYDAPLEPKEDGKRGAGDIDVRLQGTWAPGAVLALPIEPARSEPASTVPEATAPPGVEPTPPANRPPTIVAFTPTDTRIEVARGAAQRFAVEATDADGGDPLAYSWLLDGRPRTKGSAFEMDEKVPAGQHRVEVKVSDKSGQTATQRWTVAVAEPASLPSITAVKPAGERITAETDGALDFSAVANLAGGTRQGAVTYEWRIDTGPSRTTTTGQFRLPPLSAGTHKLTVVAVSPEGLKSAPRDWTIEVKPKGTKTALAESEVRDWLALYRRAWENKDVDLLIQLGEVTQDRAPKLRETLAGYDNFRVEVKALTIRIDADSARVTFWRRDTIDGKTLPHPHLQEVLLEKQANGRLTRHR